MYLQIHCFYKIGYASSRLYRRRFLEFLLYRRKQEQTTTTFPTTVLIFFGHPSNNRQSHQLLLVVVNNRQRSLYCFRQRCGSRDGSTGRFPFFLCVPRSLGRTIYCTTFYYILAGTNSAGSMRMVETLIDLFFFSSAISCSKPSVVPEHFGGYCVLWPV